MKTNVEEVDWSPGEKEARACQDQHHVGSSLSCDLPCSARACQFCVTGGRYGQADLSVEDTNDDAGEDELDEDADESEHQVIVVRIPVL